MVLAERLTAKRAGTSSAPHKDRHIIALVNGVLLIVAGGVIAAPSVQMSIGLYPEGMGVADVVVNTVFSFVKCSSAAVQSVRAAGYKDPVTRELRNIGLVTAFMSMLMLQTTIIAVFAHGYSMWEYVVGLAGIVATSTVVMGVVSVARNGYALTHANEECVGKAPRLRDSRRTLVRGVLDSRVHLFGVEPDSHVYLFGGCLNPTCAHSGCSLNPT